MAVKAPRIPLPKDWSEHIKAAVLHTISLARTSIVAARGRAAGSRRVRCRLQAKLAEAEAEISQLKEELRLKDLRMARVRPRRRPHYRAMERLAILELRAARGWSRRQTAKRFLLQPATVAAWMKRVDEGGERSLLKTPEPVNRLSDFVRHIVKRLKVLCPTMGKMRIAQTLARAGLALSTSSVGRMLKEPEEDAPNAAANENPAPDGRKTKSPSPVNAKENNHVWQIDLTVVPTAAGLWTPWFPFALQQVWPFCWWVGCVVDHYSRTVVGFAVFSKQPTSIDIRRLLGRLRGTIGTFPKYIVSDKGKQFDCDDFRAWCERREISPRYASTGSLRATAVIERFIRSLKDEWLRCIRVPYLRDAMQRELSLYKRWFERDRPHQGLDGRTPNEVANDRDVETPTITTDQPIELIVDFHEGRKELPIVSLKNVA